MHFSSDADQNPATDSNICRERSIPAGCTVLVVEDNSSNYVQIARMLGSLGIYCEWKTSGYEVVEFAESLPRVDFILMDIFLPYEDGFLALKKLRNSDQFAGVPIIAISVHGSVDQMEKTRTNGFDGFLGNPLDPDCFPDQICNIICGNPVWELN